jgi:uncharacterized protein YbcI
MVISVHDRMGRRPSTLRTHMKRVMVKVALHGKIALCNPLGLETHIVLLLSVLESTYNIDKNVTIELIYKKEFVQWPHKYVGHVGRRLNRY